MRCTHMVTEAEAGDPRAIGPCGRETLMQCSGCGEWICKLHVYLVPGTVQPTCQLCWVVATTAQRPMSSWR